MSCKFNRSPTPRLRPPICIAPHGSCLPPLNLLLPERLHGALRHMDLDPLAPVSLMAHVFTDPRTVPIAWTGRVYLPNGYLGVTVTQTNPNGIYDVTLHVLDEPQPPGDVAWINVFIDPAKAFNTGPLSRVNIPGMDLSFVWLLG